MNRSITGIVIGAGLVFALAGCERPPIDTEQLGYRGTGMVKVTNPRLDPEPEPPAALPPVPGTGPRAGDIYSNVQVLDDLSVAEFARLMTAMTSWVAPEEGCNYCHVPGNLASDDIYTKVVSRRMLTMTRYINTEHQDHVADTGVTCYTCHRGQPVPEQIWTVEEGPAQAPGLAGYRAGQNLAMASTAYTSLPFDPFQRFMLQSPELGDIRVVAKTALPTGSVDKNIKDTEWTYGLMMHVSDALGVNCTYCHNSRSFMSWPESSPARINAWHGFAMVADLNEDYLEPLAEALPDMRLGPQGDAPKANCATCHQGLPKPLNGRSMLTDYPSLARPVSRPMATAAVQ